MIYLPIITAIISGLLVWVLGRLNTDKEEKKQEKKRLKRLLYNMLELKHWIDKEIGVEPFITKYTDRMLTGIAAHFPDKPKEEFAEMQSMLAAGLKRIILKQPQLPRLEQNIEEIIREFSEIDPFFAFDLTGKYQLTDTLEIIKTSLQEFAPDAEVIPAGATQMLEQILRPKMMEDLQRDLITHMAKIAGMIDKASLKRVEADHLSTKFEIDENSLEEYCNDMVPRLIQGVENFDRSEITAIESH